MENTVGSKAVIWGSVGGELMGVVFDLRYMVLFSVVLILADLWWGYSESKIRLGEAKVVNKAVLIDKYRWHKSRALRRTANKLVDYLTYLIVGALFGIAITEPMGWCDHIITASVGLGLGCICEIASIIGHIAFVKYGVEVKVSDVWSALLRFIVAFAKRKNNDVGGALEDTFDKEQNMEN